ncbi:MAG TPA: TetR/AcrR family transcriptional regulator [Mogibacterium sp.]|nr:TetR/AcrR family transcriptional regulator [Mogibacterium sp.]
MTEKEKGVVTETKRNIMDAYWDIYTSGLVSKITVKMITNRAGYNRGTFYAYFLDIEDLHNQIEDELLPSEESFAKLREATFSKNSKEIIELFMKEDKVSGEKVSFLLGPNGSLSFQIKLKTKLRELIIKYAPLDLKEPEKVIDYKADIVCSLFYETVHYWYDRGRTLFTGEEMINLMMKIIFFGVTEGEDLKKQLILKKQLKGRI